MRKMLTLALLTPLALLAPVSLRAQAHDSAAPAIPEPVDAPWPGGTITLDIDATDTARGVFRVSQTVPLAPGTRSLTLLYPEWHPGKHAPRGAVSELVDLRLSADGRPVSWRRDPVDVNAFHVSLPASARALTASFVNTSPLEPDEGRIVMTPDMLNLQWERTSLYPAGHAVGRIRVRPSVTMPAGWTAATSLDGKATSAGNRISWAESDYATLVDSPVFAGRWARRWNLGNTLSLSVIADERGQLDAGAEPLAALTALGEEALATFGRAPFERYEFLVALSDKLGDIGLEHLRSTEIRLSPRTFLDWSGTDWDHNVLAHELAHAWNGKYRRPEGLATPDFRQPMRDELLWVYEGQTQFWGWVLAARSGVQRKETVLGMIASAAGSYSQMPGREWRSVADTTLDPIVAARRPKPFASLARGEDYYSEGALIWLEADQVIRAGTRGQRGLDDFARAFFAWRGDAERLSTYRFEDVVESLNTVHPHDWATFLRERIDQSGRPAPVAGIEAAGYRLVWRPQPNPYDKARMADGNVLSLHHSLGVVLSREGIVTSVRWGSPAFDAGIVGGARIFAVGGVAYDPARMQQALSEAAAAGQKLDLLVQRGSRFSSVQVNNGGGLRYPWLEPVNAKVPAGLDRLLAPRRVRTN
jgi:predicted metalloprotease with PDZ domain